MGLGNPESVYILDNSLTPISSIIDFYDDENGWPNASTDNKMLALKNKNCVQD